MVIQDISSPVLGPGLRCSVGCMPAIPLTFCPTTVIPITTWKQSFGMEQIWQAEFNALFLQYYPHVWHLSTTELPPIGQWNTFVDSAKVRFSCETCGHGWTSMKGRIAFWFNFAPFRGDGLIIFKLYGQRCDKCKIDRYEDPMWYPEEVHKVLVNAYHRVGETFYGFVTPPLIKQRRAGKPRTPHNSDLCQACKDGVCAERK